MCLPMGILTCLGTTPYRPAFSARHKTSTCYFATVSLHGSHHFIDPSTVATGSTMTANDNGHVTALDASGNGEETAT